MKYQKRISVRRRRRGFRVHNRVRRDAHGRHRLSVFRSHRHIYAQIIDDADARTLVAASSLESAVRGKKSHGGDRATAAKVGKLLAERAAEQKISEVCFDRGRYKFHGRVAALADAAREAGLKF